MNTGKCILVVDDDIGTREFLEFALSDEGYAVRSATNGAVALQAVTDDSPDLILLNMRMPVMDGESFVEAYRRRPGPHVPIVVLSAGDGVEEQIAEAKVGRFLAKPFDLDELLRLVHLEIEGDSTREPAATI